MTQVIPAASLSAVASPVDRYATPFSQAPGPAPLSGLSEALAKINPALQQYIGTRHDDYVQQETAKGMNAEARTDPEADFEANREGWLKLINEARDKDREAGTDNGDKIAASSPHFQRGFMKARVERVGLTLADHLEQQWKANPQIEVNGQMVNIKSVDDPDAIREWTQQTTNAYADSYGMMDIDPVIFAQHFTPRVAKAQAAMQASHTDYRLRARQAAYAAELSAGVGAVAMEGLKSGDMQGVVDGMQELLNDAVRSGMDPKKANEQVVTAVMNLARETRNPSVLGVLNALSTGNGPLGNIGWVKEGMLDADEFITDDIWEEETRTHTREERARTEDERAGLSEALTALVVDPDADLSLVVDHALAKGNPSLAKAVMDAQNRLQTQANDVLPDHAAMADLRYRMTQPDADHNALAREILDGTGKLWPGTIAGSLQDDLNSAVGTREILQDVIVKDHVSNLTSIVKGRFQSDMFGTDTGIGREYAYKAQLMFADEIRDYLAENPEASRSKQRAEAEAIATRLLTSSLFQNEDNMADGPSPLADRLPQPETVPTQSSWQSTDHTSEAEADALANSSRPLSTLEPLTPGMRSFLMTEGGLEHLKSMASVSGMSDFEFMQHHGLIPQ